jgi:hypothetical protein
MTKRYMHIENLFLGNNSFTSFRNGAGDFFPRWCIKFVFKLFEFVLLFLLLFDKDFSSVAILCEPVNERTSVILLLTLAFECGLWDDEADEPLFVPTPSDRVILIESVRKF